MSIVLTEMAQRLIADILRPGDGAIDATTGNGHDTLFLAHQVGRTGRVFAFDIQTEALARARQRLLQAGIDERVVWIRQGHEHMATAIPTVWRKRIRTVMFNLGYLPHGDKHLTTHPDTTLAALQQAVDLLPTGGRITVIAYTGHPGGQEEADLLRHWLSTQPADRLCWQAIVPEKRRHPPQLLVIDKR